MADTGARPDLLKLEITESGTIGDPERAVQVLSELKGLGLQLSVDDFGTGYSSLSYLHRLPLDVLKIDRSFVSGLMTQTESRQIINTILRLAESLNMSVVAEGIETAIQAEELRQLGCEVGQGYYYARPLALADAERLLEANLLESGGAMELRTLLEQVRPASTLLRAG